MYTLFSYFSLGSLGMSSVLNLVSNLGQDDIRPEDTFEEDCEEPVFVGVFIFLCMTCTFLHLEG